MKNILYLSLIKKWFDLIASGKKKVEYREIKPFWKKRLFDKEYDIIHFRNGYQPDSPLLVVEFKGVGYGYFEGKKHYAIKLGKILKTKFLR